LTAEKQQESRFYTTIEMNLNKARGKPGHTGVSVYSFHNFQSKKADQYQRKEI
jgi:hypothetical protein